MHFPAWTKLKDIRFADTATHTNMKIKRFWRCITKFAYYFFLIHCHFLIFSWTTLALIEEVVRYTATSCMRGWIIHVLIVIRNEEIMMSSKESKHWSKNITNLSIQKVFNSIVLSVPRRSSQILPQGLSSVIGV